MTSICFVAFVQGTGAERELYVLWQSTIRLHSHGTHNKYYNVTKSIHSPATVRPATVRPLGTSC